MNTKHVLDLIHDYIDGTINEFQRNEIEEHIQYCESCRAELESMRNLVNELNTLPKSLEPPPDWIMNVESKLTAKELESLEVDHRRNGKIEKKILRFVDYFNPNKVQAAWYFRAAAVMMVLVGVLAVWFTLKSPQPLQLDVGSSTSLHREQEQSNQKQIDNIGKNKITESISSPSKKESILKTKVEEKHHAKIEHPLLADDTFQAQTKSVIVQNTPLLQQTMTVATPKKDSISANIDTSQKLLYGITSIASDNGKIVGKIVDAISGEPLTGAKVIVNGTAWGAVTDLDGKFIIEGVSPGIYTLKASQVGYASSEIMNVKLNADKWTQIDLKLQPGEVQISATDITSTKQHAGYNGIQTIPNAKSVEDVSKLQAGATKQGNNLYLRGGRADEVINLKDGVEIARRLKNFQYRQRPFHTEEYDKINENEFLDAKQNPLSTFSIDVDNASYSNVRRFLQDGQLPPKDAVRIEELINYFTYNYPQPRNEHPFSITTEMSTCPWNDEHKLLLIGLQGKKIATENLQPSNLVFLLDVSGSMDEPNKLPLVKEAFKLLAEQLREEDKVSIVVYAGSAGVILPSTYGDNKEKILDAIDRLHAGGSTAGGEGILLAYKIAEENFKKNGNNRVILATDGDFNVGISSDAELERLIEEKRNSGIYLSVLGFGTGNYKDSKMEKLADKGNGNYYYIDNSQEAKKVFVGQMAGTLYTIAKDVKLQIEFNPTKVKAYRLIGYENRILAKEDFNNDTKDAGELGAGHSVTALYEIIPCGIETDLPDVDDLKYQDTHINREARKSNEILTVKFRYKPPKESESKLITHSLEDQIVELGETSDNFRWAAAVAEFGLLLRDSQFKGNSSLQNVLNLAEDARGKDPEHYRAEFIRIVEMYKDLIHSNHW